MQKLLSHSVISPRCSSQSQHDLEACATFPKSFHSTTSSTSECIRSFRQIQACFTVPAELYHFSQSKFYLKVSEDSAHKLRSPLLCPNQSMASVHANSESDCHQKNAVTLLLNFIITVEFSQRVRVYEDHKFVSF